MIRALSSAAALALTSVAACGGPDRGPAYVSAFAAGEAAESAGHFVDAAARYDEAALGARVPRDADHARYLAARALERSGDRASAAARLRTIALASPPLEDSAEAAYAIGELQIERGDAEGWAALLDVVRRFPSDGIARRALRRIVQHDDETVGPGAALARLEPLAATLERTELGETAAYERALHLAVLGEDARARDAFLAVADRWPYPHGSFWDDSLFRASVLDEKLGRYEEATRDLKKMLSERESSMFIGSYERPRYEPAMVRICALYRDRLRDRAKARDCFAHLYTDFPHSELRDDALWEEARLFRDDGDGASACGRLAQLVSEFPSSRYVPCAAAVCPTLALPKGEGGAPATCHPYIARFRLGVDDTP
jgi:TolA-binding protein